MVYMSTNYIPIRITIFLFSAFQSFSHAARILGIFPVEGRSHFNFHKGIMNGLVDAGHHVTFYSPYPEPSLRANLVFINSSKYESEEKDYMTSDFKNLSIFQFLSLIGKIYQKYCYDFMKIEEIQVLLNSDEKLFDVMFVEMLPLYECFLPVANKLGIPVIGTFSMRPWQTVDDIFGNPHSLLIPSPVSTYPLKMTFLERLHNAAETVFTTLCMKFLWRPMVEEFLQEFFPSYDLQSNLNISLLFINNHPSIFNTPLVPNVIEIAGIHLNAPKSLPVEYQKFIDQSKDGVILFTFGSVTKSNVIENKLRNIFRDTFADLSQRVIWKFEEDIENISSNVLISKWVPQRDILVYKNIKAFICHGGISGIYEAVTAGVPMIIIPVFGDQMSNAAFLTSLEVSIRLNIETLTKEILIEAVKTILHEKKYEKKMKKLSQQFWDRPRSPQETVVYWTEYVLRYNGSEHLKSVTADMNFYQYFLVDIFIALVLVLCSSVVCIMWLIRAFILKLLRQSQLIFRIHKINNK